MKLTIPSAALCAAALALPVVGCGDDEKDKGSTPKTDTGAAAAPPPTSGKSGAGGANGGGASTNLKIAADESGQFKFDTDKLSAKPGNVTITMDNPSTVPHAVAVEGNGVDEDGETVGNGGKSTVTATLKPGTYTFYCPVDGHKDAGMQGTLTVK